MSEAEIRWVDQTEGRRVRDEHGGTFEYPTPVIWSTYWERRLLDGDIVVVENPKKGK